MARLAHRRPDRRRRCCRSSRSCAVERRAAAPIVPLLAVRRPPHRGDPARGRDRRLRPVRGRVPAPALLPGRPRRQRDPLRPADLPAADRARGRVNVAARDDRRAAASTARRSSAGSACWRSARSGSRPSTRRTPDWESLRVHGADRPRRRPDALGPADRDAAHGRRRARSARRWARCCCCARSAARSRWPRAETIYVAGLTTPRHAATGTGVFAVVAGRRGARRRSRCSRSRAPRRASRPRAKMSRMDQAPPAPGPYLQTVSGRFVNPFDPDPEQIDIDDIARALANVCRFGGHTRHFYSVAQHSVIVSRLVEERGGDIEDTFAALMHDASEAYLGDMPHPIKHRSPLGAAFKAGGSAPRGGARRALQHQAGRPRDQARWTARCWPPSGSRSAPRTGTGPSSTASSRSTSSSPPGCPTKPSASSVSATRS